MQNQPAETTTTKNIKVKGYVKDIYPRIVWITIGELK